AKQTGKVPHVDPGIAAVVGMPLGGPFELQARYRRGERVRNPAADALHHPSADAVEEAEAGNQEHGDAGQGEERILAVGADDAIEKLHREERQGHGQRIHEKAECKHDRQHAEKRSYDYPRCGVWKACQSMASKTSTCAGMASPAPEAPLTRE